MDVNNHYYNSLVGLSNLFEKFCIASYYDSCLKKLEAIKYCIIVTMIR